MIVVPFIPAHLESLEVHEYMAHIQREFGQKYGEMLAEFPSYSGIVDGKVIICSGVVQAGVNRWNAWALMSKESGRHMIPITREVMKYLKTSHVPRIETHVRSDFKADRDWETPEHIITLP